MERESESLDMGRVELALVLYLRVATGVDLDDPQIARVNFRLASISRAAHQEARAAVAESICLSGPEEISLALRLIGVGPRVVDRDSPRCSLPPSAITYRED